MGLNQFLDKLILRRIFKKEQRGGEITNKDKEDFYRAKFWICLHNVDRLKGDDTLAKRYFQKIEGALGALNNYRSYCGI
tara:strand:+ start:73 stop:309 length:237 start_codon:yes stop_codon:yes gene_type:complete